MEINELMEIYNELEEASQKNPIISSVPYHLTNRYLFSMLLEELIEVKKELSELKQKV